jgi:Ca-activated chloride channel family protein
MSFVYPSVLLALLGIPLLVWWYAGQQRRRAKVAATFVVPKLAPSVAPRSPRWRRHAPMLAFALALAVLIVAAARPQRTEAVPIDRGAVMLANDVSSSMLAKDVSPSRLAAARKAASKFVADVPNGLAVGLVEFARKPTVLQSPTTDHASTQAAIAQLGHRIGGGTAIGDALQTSLRILAKLPARAGKRAPSAIVVISDGASNVGSSAVGAARQAAAQHVPVYTVSIGTPNGTIPGRQAGTTVPVPVDGSELARIAAASGGHAYKAADSSKLSAVYAHLAAQFGHKQVKHEITASVAGGGLMLLLIGSVLSLRWFGRLV